MNRQIIHTVFEHQAIINAGNIAVCEGKHSITYANLDKQANKLAIVLQVAGAEKEQVIGVFMPSGINLVTALLANFKAGTVYMPVNMAFGRRRISEVFRQSNCKVVITTDDLKDQFLDTVRSLGITITTLINIKNNVFEILKYEDGAYVKSEVNVTGVINEFVPSPDDSNYIFSTSGTTGSGKLILGSHKGLSNFVNWEVKEFNIDQSFKVSQLTSITFDASLRDVFAALTTGGTLYIPSEEIKPNASAIVEWLEQNEINLIHCVPSLFKLLTKELLTLLNTNGKPLLKHLKYIIMAGEPLYSKDVKSWYDAVGNHAQLTTMYGVTETTLTKTFHRITEVPENPSQVIHVGKPIDEAFVIIVNNNELCRIGEIGEIYIKSPYITKGYYNNQSLTDSVFVQNPLNPLKDIVYKTGDMGKYLKDRSIEIIGRIDDQVKINGVRIELKEIEQAILSFDKISEVIIIPHKDKENQLDLICYYIGGMQEHEIRESLNNELANNLIPSFFVKLDTFPLTINGKIDKKSLPKPDQLIKKQFVYEAPVNETEQNLEKIWEEVLGIKNIGRKASFFEIGGNSLKSLLVISKIYKAYNTLIKLDVIFTHRTIEQIGNYIDNARKDAFKDIPQLAQKEFYDISNSQKRAWIQHQAQAEKALYNVANAFSFSGNLNFELFQKAFQTLVQRHEILRTTFLLVDGQPKQKVNNFDAGFYKIDFIDLRELTNNEDEALIITEKKSNQIFDLENGPLFCISLIQLTDDKSILTFNIHHIISDAWSTEIITREIFTFYNALIKDEHSPLVPLKIQYKEYAHWQNQLLNSDEINEHKEFWLNEFKDNAPALNLPTTFPRPDYRTYEADSLSFGISTEEITGLQALCNESKATLFMIFTALFNIVLSKQTGQNDITIGSPVAGREHPDLENQIGFYVNTIPIRTIIDRNLSFKEFLNNVKNHLVEILKYQIYPFDQLIEDLNVKFENNRNPMFDIGFTYIKENELSANNKLALNGLTIDNVNSGFNLVKADIWIKVLDNEEDYIVDVTYNKQLFNATYIKKIMADIKHSISKILSEPELKINELITFIAGQETELEKEKNAVLKSKNRELFKFMVKEAAVK